MQNVQDHKSRVYPVRDTYTYTCTCGLKEGGYLVREYATDGWLEAHGMEPLIDYPMV
jgi:hypothetical protein